MQRIKFVFILNVLVYALKGRRNTIIQIVFMFTTL